MRQPTTHQPDTITHMDDFHNFRDAGFRDLFALYRRSHPACYALAIAYGIAFDGLPF